LSDYALQLTGGGYATAPSNPAYDFGVGDFTLEAWIKPQAAGPIISRAQTVGDNKRAGFGFGLLPDGRLQFEVSDGTNQMFFDSESTSVLDGQWHHVAAVRRGLSLEVYFDGLPPRRWPTFHPQAWINVNNQGPLTIGGGANPYAGLLNEVRVWNCARSRDDLVFSLGISRRGPRPGLVGCWSFADGTFVDSSATGNNAQGQGTTSFVSPSALSAGVEFILDGRDYFTRLKELLLTVRLAKWPDAPPFTAKPTFLNLVSEVGRLAPVRVIMWNKEYYSTLASAAWGKLLRLFGGAALRSAVSTGKGLADASARAVSGGDKVEGAGALNSPLVSFPWKMPEPRLNSLTGRALSEAAARTGANIRVFLEDYRVSDMSLATFLSSHHQKIAVFSIKGKKYALIGGINLENRYWDDARPVPHPMYDKQNYHTWHDTAVLFGEPVAAAVEREFDRRWAKQKDPGWVSGNTYVKMAFWSIAYREAGDDLNFDQDWKPGDISDPGHPTQVVDGATPVPVQVLITNHERRMVAHVQDCLLERIAAAQRYIYMEAFCFHHVKLVKAVAAAMDARQDLKVIIMVPHAFKGQDGMEDMQSFLTGQAYLAMALPLADAVKFVDGTTVTRDPGGTWKVTYGEGKPPLGELEFAYFLYGPAGQAPTGRPLTEISDLTLPADPRLTLCAPVRRLKPEDCHHDEIYGLTGGLDHTYRRIYVHSKLALFDEEYAVIGSANYNRRSMEDDGELSVLIHDPTEVARIREALFTHYGMNTVDDWRNRMEAFSAGTDPGIGVIPVSLASLARQWSPLWWHVLSLLTPTLERIN